MLSVRSSCTLSGRSGQDRLLVCLVGLSIRAHSPSAQEPSSLSGTLSCTHCVQIVKQQFTLTSFQSLLLLNVSDDCRAAAMPPHQALQRVHKALLPLPLPWPAVTTAFWASHRYHSAATRTMSSSALATRARLQLQGGGGPHPPLVSESHALSF